MQRLMLDLEDDVYAAIKARAKARGCSIGDEILWELMRGPRAVGLSENAISELEEAAHAWNWAEVAESIGKPDLPEPVSLLTEARLTSGVSVERLRDPRSAGAVRIVGRRARRHERAAVVEPAPGTPGGRP